MSAVVHVSDAQRRARLARRHALAPACRLATAVDVARAMTGLHATVASTVHLSCWARTTCLSVDDVEQALHRDRVLVKQLAMRRTLFAVPSEVLPAVLGSAAARVAALERTRMAREVTRAGIARDGQAWLDAAREQVLAALDAAPDGLSAGQIRAAAPLVDVTVTPAPGQRWSLSRVLTLLGAAGEIVHATNAGHWRTSRPRWALMRHWLPDLPEPLEAAEGYRHLVAAWLRSFGPGTEDDLAWWLGATRTAVRAALAALDTTEVSLDGGRTGWLLSDDVDPVPDPGPWVALLPVLDPTVMGWRHRTFYLGRHQDALFDSAGNAPATAWVDGRVVGTWTQDENATVRPHPIEPVPARARRALESEAERLTAWLDGVRPATSLRFPPPPTATRR